jgi:uncharacterized membrane protein
MKTGIASKPRLIHIDWARGLAVVLMIQTHAIDAWLAPAFRNSGFFGRSQLLGGFPAPAFLFLAGLSMAMGYGKIDTLDAGFAKRLRLSVKRGFEIFGFALLFRLQEFVQWTTWGEWLKLFKVDILNTIGLSLIVIGTLLALFRDIRLRYSILLLLAFLLALATPAVQSSQTTRQLPWLLGEYLGNRFDYGYFPVFPWLGFALSGAVAGLLVSAYRSDRKETVRLHLVLAVASWVLIIGGNLAARHLHHQAGWSFWRNSPEYFAVRVGIQLLALVLSFALCLMFRPQSFSFMRLLGRHSLLIYWIHITLVYGRPLHFLKLSLNPVQSVAGVLLLTAAMLCLAWLVENWRELWETIKGKLAQQS